MNPEKDKASGEGASGANGLPKNAKSKKKNVIKISGRTKKRPNREVMQREEE